MADTGSLAEFGDFIFYELIVFVAVKAIVGTKPCCSTDFIFADCIYGDRHCDCAEFSLAHFFNTAAVVCNPDVAFLVFKKLVDVIISDAVSLVVVCVSSVMKNSDSAVTCKPVITR